MPQQQILAIPHPHPFNFIDKWSEPVWKKCGVYLWSIPFRGVYLASYVGKTWGSSTNFDARIWAEYKRWKSGLDYPIDVSAYLKGTRVELACHTPGSVERELAELEPHLRLWLIPILDEQSTALLEKWMVWKLVQDPVAGPFLANKNTAAYRPDFTIPVEFDASPQFQIVGLNVASSSLSNPGPACA